MNQTNLYGDVFFIFVQPPPVFLRLATSLAGAARQAGQAILSKEGPSNHPLFPPP